MRRSWPSWLTLRNWTSSGPAPSTVRERLRTNAPLGASDAVTPSVWARGAGAGATIGGASVVVVVAGAGAGAAGVVVAVGSVGVVAAGRRTGFFFAGLRCLWCFLAWWRGGVLCASAPA